MRIVIFLTVIHVSQNWACYLLNLEAPLKDQVNVKGFVSTLFWQNTHDPSLSVSFYSFHTRDLLGIWKALDIVRDQIYSRAVCERALHKHNGSYLLLAVICCVVVSMLSCLRLTCALVRRKHFSKWLGESGVMEARLKLLYSRQESWLRDVKCF